MSGLRLLADWGTTARRAWLVDRHGSVLRSTEDDEGAATVRREEWSASFAALKQALGGDPEHSLLCGMVGSRSGWRDTPYLPCPVALEDLAGSLTRVEPNVALVPGVSFLSGETAEVMRGEETQLLGALAAGLVAPDGLACLPGTHTKWVVLRAGRIVAFRTVMTGELFVAIRGMATLAPHLADAPEDGPDFAAGVDRGLADSALPAELFETRAHALLGTGQIGNGAAYLSGLLIGMDVRSGLVLAEEETIDVIGRGELAQLYATAIRRRGRKARTVEGGTASLAGLTHLAELAA